MTQNLAEHFVDLVHTAKLESIYPTVHPERWNDGLFYWILGATIYTEANVLES